MTHRRLDRHRRCYRIGDPDGRFPIFDARGSTLVEGRWHAPPAAVIYTSEHQSTAMLEKLANGGGVMPPNQHMVEITLPADVSYEVFQPAAHPGWDDTEPTVARRFGMQWLKEARSLVLFVPSVLAPLESNLLINPRHPEFERIKVGLETPVHWDRRLFP